MKRQMLPVILGCMALSSVSSVLAQPVAYLPNANGTSFDLYELRGVYSNGGTVGWNAANIAATARFFPSASLYGAGVPNGNLASIHNASENSAIRDYVGRSDTWIGLNDVATEGTFVWTDGTPSDYFNWNGGEPNNSGGEGGEDAAHISGGGGWNDHRSDVGAQTGSPTLRYLVRYPTNTPLANLQAWKATTYKARLSTVSTPAVNNNTDADNLIAGNGAFAGRTTGTNAAATITSTGGNNVHFTPNEPYPGGISGDDFVIRGTGSFNVTTAGDYTFGISGDDGGRLKINGTDLIVDNDLHGDRDDFGQINLGVGTHTFEWIGFERAGGDGWDMFYKAAGGLIGSEVQNDQFNGNVTNANNWFALGGGGSLSLNGGVYTLDAFKSPSTGVPGFDVSSLAAADTLIATPAEQDRVVPAWTRTLNVRGNGGGGNGHFGTGEGDQQPAPGYFPDTNDYAVLATGVLRVLPGEAGLYTLGAKSDDGQRLRIDLNGDLDFGDAGEETSNGGADLFLAANLAAGNYLVEYLYWENEGDDGGEVFAALGSFGDFAAGGSAWRLLGDTANGGLGVFQVAQVVPEPSGVVLAFLGGIGLLGVRRRQKRSH